MFTTFLYTIEQRIYKKGTGQGKNPKDLSGRLNYAI